MLDFIRKACFYETKRYAKLLLLLFLDNFIEKTALSLGGLTFFLLLVKKELKPSTLYLILALYLIQFISYALIRKKTYLTNFETLSDSIHSFQINLGEKLRRLPMGFFHKKSSTELLKIIVDDHNVVNMTWNQTLFLACSIGVNLIILFLFLPFLSWQMALILFSVVPLSWFPMKVSMKRYYQASQALKQTHVATANSLMDYIKGIATLRLFHMRETEFKRLFNNIRQSRDLVIAKELAAFPISTFSTSLLTMSIGILALSGSYLLEKGLISGLVFLIFLFVGNQIYSPLITLYYLILQLSDFKEAVHRIHEFYNAPEISDGPLHELPADKTITCQDLNSSYHTPLSKTMEPSSSGLASQKIPTDKLVLKNINCTIEPEKMYALVGPSGCGKTTLLKIFLRYFEPLTGHLKLGNINTDHYHTETYLSAYSMVFQDVFLFNQSIAYNIGIGCEKASRQDIIRAAKQANCHDFIMTTENGYDTIVGVGGSKLSAGQRQRISIARAFLKDAPIILMDEPTASLDVENEFLIKQSLHQLSHHKTVVIVSHRLHFIKDVDDILLINHGQIVDSGPHQHLITTNSLYQHLWQEEQSVLNWRLTT